MASTGPWYAVDSPTIPQFHVFQFAGHKNYGTIQLSPQHLWQASPAGLKWTTRRHFKDYSQFSYPNGIYSAGEAHLLCSLLLLGHSIVPMSTH